VSGKRQYRRWTEQEDALLRARYPDEDTETLCAVLGRKRKNVYARADRLGLRKSEEFIAAQHEAAARRLSDSCFAKGSAPWNKGKAGAYRISAGGGRGRVFLPGNRPPNYRELGSEVWRSDGHLYRKISDAPGNKNCRPVYLLLWEAHHGSVPSGHAVAFRDGNYRNITLANLELVTRAEMMLRNTVQRYPEELKAVIRVKARLTRVIQQREEQAREE
jgi:hypothetical protein